MWHRDTSIQRVLHGVGDGTGIIHARPLHLRHNAVRNRQPGAPGVGRQVGGTPYPQAIPPKVAFSVALGARVLGGCPQSRAAQPRPATQAVSERDGRWLIRFVDRRGVAGNRAPMHDTDAFALRPLATAMQHSPVVPENHVSLGPSVRVDLLRPNAPNR